MKSFFEIWVYVKAVYGLGHNQTGFVKNLLHLETVALASVWVAVYFPVLKEQVLFLAPVLVVVYILSVFALGLFLEKKAHLIHLEKDFATSRDPQIAALQNQVAANQFLLKQLVEKSSRVQQRGLASELVNTIDTLYPPHKK